MNRKEELIKYLDVLQSLQTQGFKVNKEIIQTMEELQELIHPSKKLKNVTIICIEKDFDGVVQSVSKFENMIGDLKVAYRVQDDIVLKNANTSIYIFKYDDKFDEKITRGRKINILINNSGKELKEGQFKISNI